MSSTHMNKFYAGLQYQDSMYEQDQRRHANDMRSIIETNQIRIQQSFGNENSPSDRCHFQSISERHRARGTDWRPGMKKTIISPQQEEELEDGGDEKLKAHFGLDSHQ